MDTLYTDALYEIEFQRAYRMQGLILHRILHLEKQLTCYNNKTLEQAQLGQVSRTLQARIKLTNDRLQHFERMRDKTEDYKDEISVNNPDNFQRTHEARIIHSAYERAYAPESPVPVIPNATGSILGRLMTKFVAMHQR